jgi:exosome complex component RRP41
MDGLLTVEEFSQAIELALDGCRRIHELQKEALKAKYLAIKEVVEEEEKD